MEEAKLKGRGRDRRIKSQLIVSKDGQEMQTGSDIKVGKINQAKADRHTDDKISNLAKKL